MIDVTPDIELTLLKILNVQSLKEAAAMPSGDVKYLIDKHIKQVVEEQLISAQTIAFRVFGQTVSPECVMQVAHMMDALLGNFMCTIQAAYEDSLEELEDEMDEYDEDEDYEDIDQEMFHDDEEEDSPDQA